MTPARATTPFSARLAHALDRLSLRLYFRQRAAKRAFQAVLARLGPGDIAIDLGANVGEFTRAMAATGATVHAFEPDPHAFALLEKAVAGMPNVILVAAAAGTEATTARLYRSTEFHREPDRRTKSSSLFADKQRVDATHAVEVEVRDFLAYLRALPGPVALIKIDVEGSEVPLLEALLDSDLAPGVGDIFVETHERALPALAARTAALKARSQTLAAPRINWDWH